MADTLKSLDGNVPQRFKDMGDGTFAKVIVSGSSGATADQVQGNVASGAADTGNPVKVGGKYNSAALPALADGQRVDLQVDSKGNLRTRLVGLVTGAADGVSNTGIGFLQSYTTAPDAQAPLAVAEMVFNGSTWDRRTKPNLTARLISSAATTNGASVKASAGSLQKIICNNTVATDRFLKFYNKASAPTVGTDTPVLTLTLPASTKNIQIDMGALGQYFSTGIAYAITGAAADADTTAIAAGDITALNLTYS